MELAIGAIIEGRYRVDGELGRGGFATVYAGVDLAADRRVAIKVLRDADSDPQMRARFAREIGAVASLRDPHTVRLYAHGEVDGRPYVVFERVDGRDLADVLRVVGRVPPSVAEHVLRQILSSLREAHHSGVIHRDIKPENVRIFEYMGDPWQVKVLDFGLARRWDGASPKLTAAGEVVGTPRYMAPEQLLDRDLGPQTDIYSVGLVGLEMLAGPGVLQGNAWGDQIARLMTGYHFTPPEVAGADRLVPVLMRMTRRDPRARFESVEAVVAALDGAEPPARIRGAPMTIQEGEERVREVPTPALVGLAMVLCVIVGAAASWVFWQRESAPAPAPARVPHRLGAVANPAPPAIVPADPADAGAAAERADAGPALQDVGEGCDDRPPFTRYGSLGPHPKSWLTYIPSSYAVGRRHPLLFLLHGEHQEPRDLLGGSGFLALAERHQFVIVAPMDADSDAGSDAWKNDKNRDVRWLEFVRDVTAESLCIDRDRIFVVSQSDAGKAVEHLTCTDFALALAANSYRRKTVGASCTPRPTPYLLLSPTDSKHAPLDGGAALECGVYPKSSLAEVDAYWRRAHRCGDERRTVYDARGHTCVTWDCDVPYQSCVLNGGHGWPGVPRVPWLDVGDCSGRPPDFPTAEYVWEFFESVDAARRDD